MMEYNGGIIFYIGALRTTPNYNDGAVAALETSVKYLEYGFRTKR